MLRWYPPLILQVVLELTFLPVAVISIVAVNAILDQNNPWSVGKLGGTGINSEFWVILMFLAIGWTLLFLGWRGAKTAFKLLLVIWHIGLVVGSVIFSIKPGYLMIKAGAFALNISLELLGPVFTILTLSSAFFWIIMDIKKGTKKRTVSPFQKRNKLALFMAGVSLIIAGLAFWGGLKHFGIIAGIILPFALHEAIRPLNPVKELHKVMVIDGSAPR